MITFARTTDYQLVRRILTHPKVYPWLTDDFAPPPEQFQPLTLDCIWYVTVYDDNQLLGLWMLTPQTGVCCEVHTALLKAGERGREAAKLMARWIWANTPFRRIITNVPSYNRLALRFAEAAGMKRFGLNAQSFQKHGALYDQILLGLSPE